MANDPKDPNAPDPDAAVAAAEAALAQAKSAAAAAAAARARADELAKGAPALPPPLSEDIAAAPSVNLGKPGASAPPPPPPVALGKGGAQGGKPAVELGKGKAKGHGAPAARSAPPPPRDPMVTFAATGGEERSIIDKSGRWRMSRLAIATAVGVLVVTLGLFAWVMSDNDAKARMDAALDGNVCGEAGNQSCLTLLVTADKRRLETEWRENIIRQKPIFGTLNLSYEPNDATIEMYQVRFRISPEEWKSGAKDLLGTKICDGPNGADGKPGCEIPYKAWENNTTGTCEPGKAAVEISAITGKPLIALEQTFIPLFETKVDCTTGAVTEAFNYEYRVVIQHKDYDPKSVYISRSAWTPGLGAHTLEFPPLALVPKPETMLDELVKFRSELFCYMKKKKLEADKVPASVVDALRQQAGFVTIELYDRTEALLTTPEHKPWWDEQWKGIEAQKCEE